MIGLLGSILAQLATHLTAKLGLRQRYSKTLIRRIATCATSLVERVVGQPVWVPCRQSDIFQNHEGALGTVCFVEHGTDGVWVRGAISKTDDLKIAHVTLDTASGSGAKKVVVKADMVCAFVA